MPLNKKSMNLQKVYERAPFLPLERKVSAKQTDEVGALEAALMSAPKTLPLEGKVAGQRPDG